MKGSCLFVNRRKIPQCINKICNQLGFYNCNCWERRACCLRLAFPLYQVKNIIHKDTTISFTSFWWHFFKSYTVSLNQDGRTFELKSAFRLVKFLKDSIEFLLLDWICECVCICLHVLIALLYCCAVDHNLVRRSVRPVWVTKLSQSHALYLLFVFVFVFKHVLVFVFVYMYSMPWLYIVVTTIYGSGSKLVKLVPVAELN